MSIIDNDFILLSPLLDGNSDVIRDNMGNEIEGRTYSGILRKFFEEGVPREFQMIGDLRDNSNNEYYILLDHVEDEVKDSDSRDVNSKGYSSEKILDSLNRPIICEGNFVTKIKWKGDSTQP